MTAYCWNTWWGENICYVYPVVMCNIHDLHEVSRTWLVKMHGRQSGVSWRPFWPENCDFKSWLAALMWRSLSQSYVLSRISFSVWVSSSRQVSCSSANTDGTVTYESLWVQKCTTSTCTTYQSLRIPVHPFPVESFSQSSPSFGNPKMPGSVIEVARTKNPFLVIHRCNHFHLINLYSINNIQPCRP